MRNTLFFVVFNFICYSLAHAEFDPAFFQIGPQWMENQTRQAAEWQNSHDKTVVKGTDSTIDKGYPGEVIYDKYGKPVVFSGPEFDRKYAEEYVEQYNKSH
jgi:hypothetical protein